PTGGRGGVRHVAAASGPPPGLLLLPLADGGALRRRSLRRAAAHVSPIRGVISDFGGVLTTPLVEAFAAVQEQSRIPVEALGRAMARVAARDGANPLFELETGRMSEEDFLAAVGEALAAALGRGAHAGGV